MVPLSFDFFQAINNLSKTTDKKIYRVKVKELKEYALSKHNAFYPYRLALEIDNRGQSICDLERCIIQLSKIDKFNQRYLMIAATNLRQANLARLQEAVIDTRDGALIAEFACFVPDSDEERLENIALALAVPKASYLFVKYREDCLIEQHKKVLIRSKKSKYLYLAAKHAKNQAELELIQDLICANKSNYFVRILATLPNVNQKKIEDRIIASEDFQEIRKLYQITKSQRLAKFIILM